MKKPYVIINCAMSLDGKISLPSGKQIRISCKEDMIRMYELRNQSDAVLVGINTVLSEDPKLTVKEKYIKKVKQPIRIVLDSYCKTPINAMIVNDKAKTLIITKQNCKKEFGKNIELIKISTDKSNFLNLKILLDLLYRRGINKLMVEGGSTVITNFLKQKLVDEFYVYIGPIIIGGIKSPTLINKLIYTKIDLTLLESKKIGKGILLKYSLIK
jgi:2,5-diamino-6-(ribosylamino)-4(3H)-pyrimidinone 5'-phosphate reductase